MADADVVITGTVLTVDETRPTVEALAVADGRIIAVGDRSEIDAFIGTDTQTIDIGDGCVMPGFIEAHGHPLMEAIALSDRLVDIRPVTLRSADDVVAAVHREVAHRGPDGAYLNGWDPLLQSGLPQPTLAWLSEVAPDGPLVIMHNSGHKAFFNSHAARRAGLTRTLPTPRAPSSAATHTVSWTAPPRKPARCSRCWPAPSSPATTRTCCAPSVPGSTGPD